MKSILITSFLLLTACGRNDTSTPAAHSSSQSTATTSTTTAAEAAVSTSFAFADDDAGRWLAANLAPPAELPLAPVAPVAAPAPRKAAASDEAAFEKLASLPQPVISVPPHILAVEQGDASPRGATSAADMPELDVADCFAAPPAPVLVAGPLTYVPSVAIDRPLPLAASPKAADERPAPSFDPTQTPLRVFSLPIVNVTRAGLVPFQKFTIPSPVGDTPALPSLSTGGDLDAPVSSVQSRPPAPTLK